MLHSAAPLLLLLQVSRILYSSWILWEVAVVRAVMTHYVVLLLFAAVFFFLKNIEKRGSFAARLPL
jgi:hypothetical protein